MTQVVLVVVVLVALVGGTLVGLRLMRSSADQEVAFTARGAEQHRDDVVAAAGQQGWSVEQGDEAARHHFPDDLVRARVPAEVCELSVTGQRPRPFSAQSWVVHPQRVGGAATTGRQHYLTVRLTRDLPRFAVAKAGLLGLAWQHLPDDLLPQDAAPSADGVRVWGDDRGLVAWLRPVLPELVAAEVWLVVSGDRLVLVRSGQVDAAGLAAQVVLADRLATALEAAGAAPGPGA